MRYQGAIVAVGTTDDSTLRFRLTPATTVLAQDLLRAVTDAGFTAHEDIDLNYDDDVAESDDNDPIREDAYRQIVIDADGQPTLCVCDGGIFVTTDSLGDENQAEYSLFVRLIGVAERVSGGKLLRKDELLTEAGHYGVDPDGSIRTPAKLTERALNDAAAALIDQVAATPDRLRPPNLVTSPALDAIAAVLDAALAVADRPAIFTYKPNEAGYGSTYSPQTAAARQAKKQVDADIVFRLYLELGSDDTGRPGWVRITLPITGRPHLEVHFDTLAPIVDAPNQPPLGWEHDVLTMSRRDPQWVPAWIPQALDLLRSAGRQI